ncbi:MAG: hypothetical protein R2736_06235 [Solirubrobacterales bacterium]
MTIQIAVKLPDELVHAIDGLVERGAFPNRSQAVRMGLEAMVAASERQEAEQLYRDAVARVPETEAELDEATRLAIEAIHDEPWERWW